jgi:transcriptional regulator of heat shock response
MRGVSVARHPDVDFIISLIKKGHGARSVAKIINDKYKNNERYRVNWMTVSDFRKNFLHLSKEDMDDLRAIAKEKGEETFNDKDLALQAKIQKKNEIMEIESALAERRMDIQEELEKLLDLALTEIDSINGRVKDMKADRDFVTGKATLISAVEQVRKILVDIKNEQNDNHAVEAANSNNVVIQFGHVDGYVKAMKQAIVETFRELGYLKELPLFLDKLSARLAKINSIEIRDASGAALRVSSEGAVKALSGGDNG